MRKPARGALDKAPWLALGATGFVLAVVFALGFVPLVQRLFCPIQVQQTESYMVDRALLFFSGETLYPNPFHGGPYLLTAYPPFYFFLQALLLKITGGLWLAGRLLSMAGYLGCGILISVWGWNRWGKVQALCAALLFLLSPTWALWGSMVRPDTLSLFLQFGAFLVLFRDSERGGKAAGISWGLLGAGLLGGAAVCVKQTTVSLWLAYGLYSVIRGNWNKRVYFFMGAFLPVAAVFFWEQWTTHGLYLLHTGPWLDTGYDFKTLEYFLAHRFLKESALLVLAVVFLWIFAEASLLLKCQVFFSSLQLLFLGRNGGAENYALEFWLYGMVFAAEGLWFHPPELFKTPWKWIPAPWVLAMAAMLAQNPWPSAPPAEEIRMKQDASKMYLGPGPYLALDLDLLVMAGKRIWYQPVEYQYLYDRGRWDGKPLLDDIRLKKFKSIELYDLPAQYLMPSEIVSEIKKDYRPAVREYGRVWYLPN